MRSPWQLIKGFASHLKSNDAVSSVEEAVPNSDTQIEAVKHRDRSKNELESHPYASPQSTGKVSETEWHPNFVNVGAHEPLATGQTDLLPPNEEGDVAPEVREATDPVTPGVETTVSISGVGTFENLSKKRRSKALQARENFGERALIKATLEQPAAREKTAVDAARDLDLEIKNLRLQLSAKLLEQNVQLRRMLDRYDT